MNLSEIIVNFLTGKKRSLLHIDATGACICLVASSAVFFAVLYPLIKQQSLRSDQRDKLAVRREESLSLSVSMRAMDSQLTTVEQELVDKRDWDTDDPLEFDFEPVFTMPDWL